MTATELGALGAPVATALAAALTDSVTAETGAVIGGSGAAVMLLVRLLTQLVAMNRQVEQLSDQLSKFERASEDSRRRHADQLAAVETRLAAWDERMLALRRDVDRIDERP
jgi:uncharacterized protein YlxW (UPF0749 family)